MTPKLCRGCDHKARRKLAAFKACKSPLTLVLISRPWLSEWSP